jgi:hypothetical protein
MSHGPWLKVDAAAMHERGGWISEIDQSRACVCGWVPAIMFWLAPRWQALLLGNG